MFAGIIILILLFIHMIAIHLDSLLGWYNPAGGEGIDWENVVARAKDVTMTVTYVILLAAALFHGLYGFRTIILELVPIRVIQKVVGPLFALSGLILFIIGTWAVIKFHYVAQAM